MSAVTVANLLTEVRYDLNDHAKQKFDDTYLLYMLKRGIRILDRELIRIGSDLTIKSTSTTLAEAANTINMATTIDNILWVYVDPSDVVYKKSLQWLYRYRIEVIGSSTGQPKYFAVWNPSSGSNTRKIEFDYTADQDYTIYYIYHGLTGAVTTATYMPYDDMFNDYLREGVVVLAQKSQDNKVVQIDQIWREIFRRYIHSFNLSMSYIPKYHYLDF